MVDTFVVQPKRGDPYKTTDFTETLGRLLTNGVYFQQLNEFDIIDQVSPALDIKVDTGRGLALGCYVELSVLSDAKTLTDAATNHVYIQVTLNGSSRVTGAAIVVNTTGVAPSNSFKIGEVVTAAGDISTIDQSVRAVPLLIASGPFGNGSDGDATNPTSPTVQELFYNDLTFSANTTWTMTTLLPVIIRVKGTLTIDASVVWTINGTENFRTWTSGGSATGVPTGGNGGSGNTVMIIAKKVVAGSSAKIQINATAGTNGAGGGSTGTVTRVNTPSTNPAVNLSLCGVVGEQSAAHSAVPSISTEAGFGGVAAKGISGNLINVTSIMVGKTVTNIINSHHSNGGAGGSTGSETISGVCAGGGAGSGGSSILSPGGTGGRSSGCVPSSGGSEGGAGGGGGGGSFLMLITETDDADLTLESIAGAGGQGGAGGDGGTAGGGGGGGGGGATVFRISDSDVGTETATAGVGGAVNGSCVATVGSTGGTGTAWFDITKIKLV